MSGPLFEAKGISVRFGGLKAVDDVSFSVDKGEVFTIIGPNGAGKTTVFNIISRIYDPTSGEILLEGRTITDVAPHRVAGLGIARTFQNIELFEQATVLQNLLIGAHIHRTTNPLTEALFLPSVRRAEVALRAHVEEIIDLLDLAVHRDSMVAGLPYGARKVVELGRALATKPKLLLLDEPFSALDRKLREAMQIDLKRLLRELGTTAIFVTHDQDEALMMSDRVAVMNRGRIEQLDTPDAIYKRPATPFALEFVGLSTRIAGTALEATGPGEVAVATDFGRIRGQGRFTPGSPVLIGVRPELMAFGARPDENTIKARLTDIVFQGSRVQAHFAAPPGEPIQIESVGALPAGLAAGTETPISWPVAETLVYPRLKS